MAYKPPPNIITDLPSSLSCTVFSDWIDLKALARVDSAFCLHSVREVLLALLQSSELVNNGEQISKAHELVWLVERNVKASRFNVAAFCLRAEIKILWWYLEKNAKFVHDVTVNSSDIEGLSKCCNNLKFLACTCSLEDNSRLNAFRTLLLHNKGLTHLEFHMAGDMDVDWSHDIQLPQLQSLIFVPRTKSRQQVQSFFKVAPNLMKLFLQHPDAILSASNCPHLRTLAVNGCDASDEAIRALATSCPNIIHLSLESCSDLTDAHVLMLVAKFKLRSLRLDDCPQLTELALYFIARFCADTLEFLTVDNERMTQDAVAHLRQACTKLRHFRWVLHYRRDKVGIDTRYTLLFMNMPLHDVIIDEIVAQYPSIETIFFYSHCNALQRCTARGLRKLIQGCPKMHTLLMREKDAVYARRLVAAFPQLTIRTGDREVLDAGVNVMFLPVN